MLTYVQGFNRDVLICHLKISSSYGVYSESNFCNSVVGKPGSVVEEQQEDQKPVPCKELEQHRAAYEYDYYIFFWVTELRLIQ